MNGRYMNTRYIVAIKPVWDENDLDATTYSVGIHRNGIPSLATLDVLEWRNTRGPEEGRAVWEFLHRSDRNTAEVK